MPQAFWRGLFVLSGGFTAYVVWLYPALLRLLAPRRAAPAPRTGPPPKVTVVVACFNEAGRVERKAADVLAADYPKELLSLIFVDNSSTDGTPEALERLAARLPLKVLRSPRGKINALNAALKEADGDLVVCTDCDAWWEPSSLKTLVRAFEDPSVGAACGVPVIHRALFRSKEKFHAADFTVRRLEGELNACTALDGRLMAFRRSALARFDESLGIDDMGLSHTLRLGGLRSVVVPAAVIHEECEGSVAAEFAQIRRHVHTVMVCVWAGRGVLFNPRFGWYGMLTLPSRRLFPLFVPAALAALLVSAWNIHPRAAAAAGLAGLLLLTVDSFPALQAAAIVAAWGDFLSGRRGDVWSRGS